MTEDRKVKGTGPVAIALAEALGLNPRLTKSIRLDCVAGEMMLVTVEQFLTEKQAYRLGSVFTKYHLVPKDGTTEVTAIADQARAFSVVTPPIGPA